MGTFNDLSKLKFKPAPPEPAPEPPKPASPADRALAGASNASDYFSSLLGPGEERRKDARTPAAPERHTTIVTPSTISRVREEQAASALAAEREAAAAREAELSGELEAQKAACESLAADLAQLRDEHAAALKELDELRAAPRPDPEEISKLSAEVAARDGTIAERDQAIEERDREISRLKDLLVEAQRTSLSSSVMLEKPPAFAEKFTGELREHVVETLRDAYHAAEAAGRDRRARILEAVIAANPPSGELEARREAVRQIVKDAGSNLDASAIAELEKIGFRYISGKNHHKIDWAGIRFPLAKTPSDYRACLNSSAEIINRVF